MVGMMLQRSSIAVYFCIFRLLVWRIDEIGNLLQEKGYYPEVEIFAFSLDVTNKLFNDANIAEISILDHIQDKLIILEVYSDVISSVHTLEQFEVDELTAW